MEVINIHEPMHIVQPLKTNTNVFVLLSMFLQTLITRLWQTHFFSKCIFSLSHFYANGKHYLYQQIKLFYIVFAIITQPINTH